MAEASTEERGFEAILKELEGLVGKLERADVPLDEALAAFEQGVALSRQGQAILDAAEKRVEQLLADGSREPMDDAPGEG